MGVLENGDAVKLLKNPEFVDELVAKICGDPQLLTELADELADTLENAMKQDGVLRKKILTSMSGSETFRRHVAEELARKLG